MALLWFHINIMTSQITDNATVFFFLFFWFFFFFFFGGGGGGVQAYLYRLTTKYRKPRSLDFMRGNFDRRCPSQRASNAESVSMSRCHHDRGMNNAIVVFISPINTENNRYRSSITLQQTRCYNILTLSRLWQFFIHCSILRTNAMCLASKGIQNDNFST